MKRVCLVTIASVLCVLCGFSSAAARYTGTKIRTVYEGETADPLRLYAFSNNDYLSVREIAGLYGSHVVYHPVTGKVTLQMNNKKVDVYIKSTRVYYGDKKKRLSSPSRLVSGEVFVPLSFVLTEDFSEFSDTVSSFNPETNILTVEQNTNVSPPRFYSSVESSRLVFELDEKLSYTWDEDRESGIEVILMRGRVRDETISVNDGVIKNITLKNMGRQAQVVIALDDSGAGKIDKKYVEEPPGLEISVERLPSARAVYDAAKAEALSTALEPGSPPEGPDDKTEDVSTASPAAAGKEEMQTQAGGDKIVIVLDAGHGGEDPGAIGPNGTKEKDVNLAITKRLKTLLDNDENFKVFLTRRDDTFIPLVERTSYANDKKADLFISIHCNASMKNTSSGFEIYFLSENASDSDAAATAILENSVIELEGKPDKQRTKLQTLLWSMTVNEFINESSELCSLITKEVTKRIRIENRGVKQAGFYVLRGAAMPAALVECAFISNYGEEAKLKSRKFQSYIADSIYEGIMKYEGRKNSLNAKKR
ncbi:MAG: N-acetylmuramoyl-L-alanine amidase [Endomicrobiales bacterium]|nr:N-acetylmuramoyl-L-alanine amidase [Endomicrobiales bacterium]